MQAATDYPVFFTAKDAWGNTAKIEATIGVDVLVIPVRAIFSGSRSRRSSSGKTPTTFEGLSKDTVDNNLRVLKRIAQILNKFRDYKVKVEGHANPVLKTCRGGEERTPAPERKTGEGRTRQAGRIRRR